MFIILVSIKFGEMVLSAAQLVLVKLKFGDLNAGNGPGDEATSTRYVLLKV